MTDQTSSLLAILFGLGVFAVIVAVGWRSVQNRRILRLQDADGGQTIIVADEDDEITSVTTTAEAGVPVTDPAPSVVVVNAGSVEPVTTPEVETAVDAEAEIVGRERLDRVVSSTK